MATILVAWTEAPRPVERLWFTLVSRPASDSARRSIRQTGHAAAISRAVENVQAGSGRDDYLAPARAINCSKRFVIIRG
jgi:hypothetical protein